MPINAGMSGSAAYAAYTLASGKVTAKGGGPEGCIDPIDEFWRMESHKGIKVFPFPDRQDGSEKKAASSARWRRTGHPCPPGHCKKPSCLDSNPIRLTGLALLPLLLKR